VRGDGGLHSEGSSSSPLDSYLASFTEPAGYLNFGSYGPPSRNVVETIGRLAAAASTGTTSAELHAEDERALAAVTRLSGFNRDGVALTSSTSLGLLQIAFGLPRGEVIVSSAEFPSNLYAWWRSEEAGLTTVRSLPAIPGQPLPQVTPERVADAIGPNTVAVAVSAVDFRTGAVADLAALREAVGDRLLVVDGIQGFGAIEVDWTLADALVVGGQKWLRAGWGTGFVALSPRALDRVRPLLGGWTGVEGSSRYDGVPHAPLPGAQRLSVTNGSPFASGALATALEQLESVGVDVVASRIADTAGSLIDRLDAAGIPVLSPDERDRRAGIVVAGLPAGEAPTVAARLDAAGVTTTIHGDDRVRFSVHATTTPTALDAALTVLKGHE
jgi:selenocysteine lyase/cysteine desulfurase